MDPFQTRVELTNQFECILTQTHLEKGELHSGRVATACLLCRGFFKSKRPRHKDRAVATRSGSRAVLTRAENPSADSQFINLLQRRAAHAADDGAAIAAHERVGNFGLAQGAIEGVTRLLGRLGHETIVSPPASGVAEHGRKKFLQRLLNFIQLPVEKMVCALDPVNLLGLEELRVKLGNLIARAVLILSRLDDQFGFRIS